MSRVVILCSALLLAYPQGPGPLAQRLLADRASDWITVSVPGVLIYLRRGSAAESDQRTISDSVTAVRRDLLALLGSPQSGPTANLFFVNSRNDMQRLAGAPLAGFIQQGESTGVFVYARGYRLTPLLRHELAHLYTFQLWGAPRAGRWLVEGVGAWAGGDCQGYSLDQLSAGARARGALVPLTKLATSFRELPEDVAMPEAGSLVGFLVRRGGVTALKDLWQRVPPPGEHPLGPKGDMLERTWLDSLKNARPATLDIPRVIKEGC